jgi:hypothetical protein
MLLKPTTGQVHAPRLFPSGMPKIVIRGGAVDVTAYAGDEHREHPHRAESRGFRRSPVVARPMKEIVHG